MTRIGVYHLKPTEKIPNNQYPLLHYQQVFSPEAIAGKAFDAFQANGWITHWIFRYGETQESHYHSKTHECMAVLSGTATIRFGAADLENEDADSMHEDGVEIQASSGDVFVIPAGVAHKTFKTRPSAAFDILTPGEGRGIDAVDARQTVANAELTGFTMLGAYPAGHEWDFKTGDAGDHDEWRKIWSIAKPQLDPLLGDSPEGLCRLWQK